MTPSKNQDTNNHIVDLRRRWQIAERAANLERVNYIVGLEKTLQLVYQDSTKKDQALADKDKTIASLTRHVQLLEANAISSGVVSLIGSDDDTSERTIKAAGPEPEHVVYKRKYAGGIQAALERAKELDKRRRGNRPVKGSSS